MYEMCTLRHAFNAKDMSSLVYKILKGKVRFLKATMQTNCLYKLTESVVGILQEGTVLKLPVR